MYSQGPYDIVGFPNPHRPSKRLGQNFLLDQRIASDIVSSIRPTDSDTVLEPGPGHGTLTRLLAEKVGKVVAIEKDPVLARELIETFRDHSNVVIVEGDILKTHPLPDFNKIVGTPPYYLSSKLALFLSKTKFDSAGIVLQREFGQRLLADPGTREYGRLTVSVRRRLKVEKIREIPRTAFRPKPEVNSILLRITPQSFRRLDEPSFEEVVRGVFTQRRRLVRGALLHFLAKKLGKEGGRKIMNEIAVPNARVYQLSISQFEDLSEQLAPKLDGKIAPEMKDDD
ncbi:MAG TPA: 16S rRNA (adenine(1518)-N(6)/adenine(1519)-N(6))-dimethyltransferase RsmA [Candidatus Angelobacter sp.]|nr:16S rRNA (adenine(1518)-N(6)/adenine(1519)-N(6))-dimethyltransferase RsmA [Candidatus Angelobacter sp.]